MFPNGAFRVIDSKTVFKDLNLSTEIQFSTDVAYLYWVVSSNKKAEAYLESWHLCSDVRGQTPLNFK